MPPTIVDDRHRMPHDGAGVIIMRAFRPTPLATVLLLECGLGIVALGVGALIDHAPATTLRVGWVPLGLGIGAALPMLALFWVFWHAHCAPLDRIRRRLEEILGEMFADSSVAAIALVALAAGFGEEMLFRGLLQGWLDQFFHARSTALCIASVLFGVAHPVSYLYVVLATGLGFYLGWLWIETGNLLVPILTHATYDFGALLALVRLGSRDDHG
jgi:membrane protease YdiL (CAAX protease family)